MSTQKSRTYTLRERARRLEETRRRIVRVTVDLHEEVGPARTTIAEIARRAGVERLTVYNHFPDIAGLIGACQAHFLAEHPPPDVSEALAVRRPEARLKRVLEELFAYYRATERMTAHLLRDREVVPELDAALAQTMDPFLDQLAETLAAGFRGGASDERRALVRLALDFWTWRRLTAEGLDDTRASEVLVAAIRASG